MPTPTCTTASLNIACFRGQKLSPNKKLVLRAYYKAKELAANGGTDYSGVLATTGLTAARTLFDKWDRDSICSAKLAIDYKNAVSAGATVSADPNVVIALPQVNKATKISEDDLEKIITMLDCQLGVHRNPPA